MKNAGALVVIGLVIAGVVFLLTRNSKSHVPYQGEYHMVGEPPSPFFDSHSQVIVNLPLYENEERWEVKRGEDRLIEEIVVHRKVTANA